jgi:NagD protein
MNYEKKNGIKKYGGVDLDRKYARKSFIIDMDGVIYFGHNLMEGARDFIMKLKSRGNKYLFLTNNSSLTPLDLSKKLTYLGIDATENDIFTSAMATAFFLNRQKKNGSAYVIGDAGLYDALHDVGYNISEYNPDYVIFGETRTYSLEMIEKACRFINSGARFIATNPDITGPSDYGIVPAVGALTSPIEKVTGVKPYFIGKPNPLMMRSALKRLNSHSENSVMIGDRMDTDVLAGLETGLETILVLSGVTKEQDVKRYPYQPSKICKSIKDVWP